MADPNSGPGTTTQNDLSDSLSYAENKAATVFVGRLPRRTSAKVVADFFAAAGVIRRVLFSKETYLFVEFETVDSAIRAVQMFNGQLFGSNSIIVQPSLSLRKLFVGNIKKTLIAQVIFDHIAKIEGGLSCVELFEVAEAQTSETTDNSSSNSSQISSGVGGTTTFTRGQARTILPTITSPSSSKSQAGTSTQLYHRGFCFAEFEDHESAHRALIALNTRLTAPSIASLGATGAGSTTEENSESIIRSAVFALSESSFRGDNEIRVDWAEPLHEVAPAVMDTVRILYVSNLPPSHSVASEHILFDLFSSISDSDRGPCIEHVKRIKNFAFVHFKTRQDAENALEKFQGHIIGGHAIKVQWSKPPPRPSRASDQLDVSIDSGYAPHSRHHQQQQQQQQQYFNNSFGTNSSSSDASFMGASAQFPIMNNHVGLSGAALALQQQYARNQQQQFLLQQRQQQMFQMQLRQQQAALQQQFEVVAQQQAAVLAQQQAALFQSMGIVGMQGVQGMQGIQGMQGMQLPQGLQMLQIPMMQPFMMEAPYGFFPQQSTSGIATTGEEVNSISHDFGALSIGGESNTVTSQHDTNEFSDSVVTSESAIEVDKNLQLSGEVGLDLTASAPPSSPRTISIHKSSPSNAASVNSVGSPFLGGSRASSQASSQYSSPRHGQGNDALHVSLSTNDKNQQGGIRRAPQFQGHSISQPRGGGGGGGGGGGIPSTQQGGPRLVAVSTQVPVLSPSGSSNSLPGAASGANRLKVVDSFTDLMGSISDEVRKSTR
jgi:RNA recognition motif-containing protein